MHVEESAESVTVGLSWREFARRQLRQVLVRVLIVAVGACSSLFWAGVIIGVSHLYALGLGPLAVGLLCVWIVVSLPALAIQSGLIVDLLCYALIGRTVFLPFVREIAKRGLVSKGTAHHTLAWVTSVTSPLACLALFALIIGTRTPDAVRQAIRTSRLAELALADGALSRFGIVYR